MANLSLDIAESSLEIFLSKFQEAVLDGYVVGTVNPGDVIGYGLGFTVSMIRNENTVEDLRKIGMSIEEKPKLTRAEILEKARAVRKANLDTNKIVE